MNTDEAKRKAEAAPDREKLLGLAKTLLMVECPHMETDAGRKVRNEAGQRLDALAAWIRNLANQL